MPNNPEPRVWMNVTTSVAWTRPPVGIVRVETEMAAALAAALGPERFRRCIWVDGQFVSWTGKREAGARDRVDRAVDSLLPNLPSLSQARQLLGQALRAHAVEREGPDDHLAIELPTRSDNLSRPVRGDFLVSIGLDWDGAYTAHFHELQRDRGVRIITCCYDLIPVLFPHYCVGDVAAKFKNYFATMTWGSEAVLCISDNTRRDYETLCREMGAPARETAVIPLGDQVSAAPGEAPGDEVERLLASPYILFVSTIERRKNHEVLYRAYRLLRERRPALALPKLVFVGMPGWGVGDLLKDIELDPLTKGLIVQLNHVSDADLAHLYRHAFFCAYPSLYEGWGLPVAEALTAGKLVLASDKGSLPEVGGDLVTYLDPWSPQAWADEIERLVDDPAEVRRREARVQREYVPRHWSDAADIVVGLIERLKARPRPRSEVLYPGYDLSTQAGVHVGPSLRSVGKTGFLMFGPYRSISPGRYRCELAYGVLSPGAGTMVVELVAGVDMDALWRADVKWDARSPRADLVYRFEVDVPVYIAEYELRVMVDESIVQLDRIELQQLS
jgi:glycosyltransferase involved in cell wall biosynthesis